MNFRTLDLNLLRVFDVVMVERNVTRAAARLAMTQPAVSNALRRLREATREELFVTGRAACCRPRTPPRCGRRARGARRLRQALDPQGFDPTRDARSFTLAMADATAAVLMPPFVDALLREHALADVRVLPLTSRDPRPLLEHGAADVAVGFFPDVAAALAAEGERAMIALDALYGCEYVAVMRRGHPLAERPGLTLDAYCAAAHVRVSFAGRPRGFVDEALARAGRERRVMLTVSQFSTAVRVVHESDLLTVLPRSFVPASGLAEGLAVRPFPGIAAADRVGLLWHRRHERDAAQRWLRRACRDRARLRRLPRRSDRLLDPARTRTRATGRTGALTPDAAVAHHRLRRKDWRPSASHPAMDFQALLHDIAAELRPHAGEQGRVASYIPALARVPANQFGIALHTGRRRRGRSRRLRTCRSRSRASPRSSR